MMDPTQRAKLFDWVDKNTELPMLVLAGIFLVVIAAPLVFAVPTGLRAPLETVDWVIWAAFAAELLVKTYLAPKRWRYVYMHWYDVLIVAIPFFRPLRVVRSLRALRELELLRLGSVGLEATAAARSILARHGLQYALLVAGLLVIGAGAAETIVERAAGGNIKDFGTGLWWAITTVTTVGYGDTYPTTPEGRGIAVVLMLVGVAVFSFFTANIAAYLVVVHKEEEAAKESVTLSDLMAKLQGVEDEIARLRRGLTNDPSPADRRPTRPSQARAAPIADAVPSDQESC